MACTVIFNYLHYIYVSYIYVYYAPIKWLEFFCVFDPTYGKLNEICSICLYISYIKTYVVFTNVLIIPLANKIRGNDFTANKLPSPCIF